MPAWRFPCHAGRIRTVLNMYSPQRFADVAASLPLPAWRAGPARWTNPPCTRQRISCCVGPCWPRQLGELVEQSAPLLRRLPRGGREDASSAAPPVENPKPKKGETFKKEKRNKPPIINCFSFPIFISTFISFYSIYVHFIYLLVSICFYKKISFLFFFQENKLLA